MPLLLSVSCWHTVWCLLCQIFLFFFLKTALGQHLISPLCVEIYLDLKFSFFLSIFILCIASQNYTSMCIEAPHTVIQACYLLHCSGQIWHFFFFCHFPGKKKSKEWTSLSPHLRSPNLLLERGRNDGRQGGSERSVILQELWDTWQTQPGCCGHAVCRLPGSTTQNPAANYTLTLAAVEGCWSSVCAEHTV